MDAHAISVSFPDLLLSKGEYQLKPDLPFTLGVDFAGVARPAPGGSGFEPGDGVAACLPYGARPRRSVSDRTACSRFPTA